MAEEEEKKPEADEPVVHIGPVHHYLAVGLLAVGTVAAIALIWAYQARQEKENALMLKPFDDFRQEYADRCEAASFAGPVPEVVQKAYLTSPALRKVIDEQRAALKTGKTCVDVAATLKKADFVVPQPGSG
jgi:hypothetical protein